MWTIEDFYSFQIVNGVLQTYEILNGIPKEIHSLRVPFTLARSQVLPEIVSFNLRQRYLSFEADRVEL